MELWKPVLARAAAAGALGLLSIFWRDPSIPVMSTAGGLYLLATGASLWLLTRSGSLPADARQLLLIAAGAYAVGGALAVVLQAPLFFALVAGSALLAGGVVETILGVRHRRRHPLATDWLITGPVSLGTAVLLPLFIELEAHALLGVLGGSAIIVAVVLLLAALSYRHDAVN